MTWQRELEELRRPVVAMADDFTVRGGAALAVRIRAAGVAAA